MQSPTAVFRSSVQEVCLLVLIGTALRPKLQRRARACGGPGSSVRRTGFRHAAEFDERREEHVRLMQPHDETRKSACNARHRLLACPTGPLGNRQVQDYTVKRPFAKPSGMWEVPQFSNREKYRPPRLCQDWRSNQIVAPKKWAFSECGLQRTRPHAERACYI